MVRPFLKPTLRSQESHSSLSSSLDEDLEIIPRLPSCKRIRPKQPSTSPSSASAQTEQNHHYRDHQSHGGWNINYAVAHLINHLRNSSDGNNTNNSLSTTAISPTAAQAITTARTYPVPPRQWRDYPGLILPSLSDTVFAGKLNERALIVTWGRMDDGKVSGRTRPVGDGMVEVQLNAAALQGANRDEIVGTLLHHMIHAYLLVACGANERNVTPKFTDGDEDEDRGHADDRLSHNHAFATILWEIRAQAAKGEKDGARSLPIGFGHRLPSAFPHFMAAAAPRSRASTSSTRRGCSISPMTASTVFSTAPLTPHNCTHCPVSVPTISSEETSDWYMSECAPFLSTPVCMHGNELYSCSLAGDLHLVSRTSASSSYVELIHRGNKPIWIPCAAVDQFSSLKSVLGGDKGNCRRWLELPRTGVGREELGALMTFLRTQTYRPVLSSWGCNRNVEHGRAAEDTRYGPPPVIQPRPGTRTSGQTSTSDNDTKEDGPEPQVHLLHDIRVHNFASAIDFNELAAYALRRLYHAEPFTHEDPIALLEAVYFPGVGGNKVSQQLRAWTCSFLSRRDQESGEVLNVAKLRTHVAWRQPWNGLLSRGGEQGRMLLEDVRKVYAEEAMRQQWRKHQHQHLGIPYADRKGQRQPFYVEHVATEGSGQFPVTTGGENYDAKSPESSWPKWWNQYNTKHHPDFSKPQPTSPTRQRPFPQQFPQWCCGPQQHNPYAYPLPLVPPIAPFYPYYAPLQPLPQQQQPQAQMQSRCNHDTSTPCTTAATIAAAAAAATTAATRASAVTAAATGQQKTDASARLDDQRDERCQQNDERGKEGLRRPALPVPSSGRGTRRLSSKQYHPASVDGIW